MVERMPLMEVQNEAFTRRKKIQNTYGKQGKASAALAKIFTMTEEIDKKFEELEIEEKDEKKTKITNTNLEKPPRQPKSLIEGSSVSREHTTVSRSPREGLTIDEFLADLEEKSPEKCAKIRAMRQEDAALRKEARERKAREEFRLNQSSTKPSDYNTSLVSSIPTLSPPKSHRTRVWMSNFDEWVTTVSDHPEISFKKYGDQVNECFTVKKIGEGTYSSVFCLTPKEKSPSEASHPRMSSDHLTIIKLMPIDTPVVGHRAGGEVTSINNVQKESSTMGVLDPIHGFMHFRGLTICKGLWHDTFLSAFRTYARTHRSKGQSTDPEILYNKSQHYALFEMSFAGTELADIRRPSPFQIRDIFWMTALYLARAEQECQFEHRDLHISNICIQNRDRERGNTNIDVERDVVASMFEPPTTLLGITNTLITIIDYTYSRVTLPDKAINWRRFDTDTDITYDDYLASDYLHNSNATEQRITTTGEIVSEKVDPERRVQLYTYAKQLAAIEDAYNELVQQNKRRRELVPPVDVDPLPAPWATSAPKTNVVWLGYLVTVLLLRAGKRGHTKYVRGSSEAAKAVQDTILASMEEVRDFLMQDDLVGLPASAGELVVMAVEGKGWLEQEELAAFWKSVDAE